MISHAPGFLMAAWLHDIGMFIHNRAHHKHTEYVLGNLSFFRLTTEEIKLISCVARYHRKALPSVLHPVYASLPEGKHILVQKLSAILRMANALDRSHKQKARNIEVRLDKSQDVSVIVKTQSNFVLEKTDFSQKKKMYEEITGNKVKLEIRNDA